MPASFDGALVSSEFPIYQVRDERISPAFLQCLLRSRYYQRAFRAITTGHSNRRRTQESDFEALEIAFPPEKKTQSELIKSILTARDKQRAAAETLAPALNQFSDLIDHRGDEELPEIEAVPVPDDD